MVRYLGMGSVVVLTLFAVAGENPREITFAKPEPGQAHKGWSVAKTGMGEGSVWRIVADETTPSKTGYAMAQTAAGPTQLYNLCVLDDSRFQDGTVSVAVKARTGKIDQGGGLVWRYVDANNYYVCRYNPKESNFRLYTVKDGKRKQLATREEIDLPEEKWFTVAVQHTGTAIVCSLNGKPMLEVKDETFPAAGKIGLWTKADAVTHFDQVRYTPAAK